MSGTSRLADPRLFAHELAVLLEAGVPLPEALATLREQGEPARQGSALDPVLAALAEGHPLSAALARAAVVDDLFVALVAASERSGQLVPVLHQHAAWLAWTAALRQRLVAAAVYPAILVTASGAVILFLLLVVLPRFAGVFDGLGAELPAASRVLLSLGRGAQQQPLVTLALAALVPALGIALLRSPAARAQVVALLWTSPGLGARLRVLALARLYRVLALLLGAGVPVTAALRLAEPVLDAPLRPPLRAAARRIAGGQRLSASLLAEGLATPAALRMLRVGESSGRTAPMFERAASFHDDEIARLSELVTRALNPALMLLMGGLIGTVVVLMYLPIFTLMDQVQ